MFYILSTTGFVSFSLTPMYQLILPLQSVSPYCAGDERRATTDYQRWDVAFPNFIEGYSRNVESHR